MPDQEYLDTGPAISLSVGSSQQGVSVIVPAYNEEGAILMVLKQVAATLQGAGYPSEIIVVDDGSTDATYALAGQFAGARVYRHESNRGYGASLKDGIRHARYDLICITDADGSYPSEMILELVCNIQSGECDMVVGARLGAHVAIPLMRRPMKWALSRLAEMVVGEPIPDLNSGLRVFKRPVAMKFFSMLPDGFSFTTTITLGMLQNGYRVEYVPIDYHPRVGKSKIRPIRDSLNFIQLVLKIALYFAPLKIFLPISGALFLLGLAWGLFSRFALGRFADASTMIVIMTSLQVAVIGLLAELLDRRLPGYQRDED